MYAVFLIQNDFIDQQVTGALDFETATNMAIVLQADAYLENPESCGDVFGNFVVMPLAS